MRLLFLAILAIVLSPWTGGGLRGLESASEVRPGIRSVRLLTDISAVVPGETFTVGLLLDPLPGYHTYWRGPGIVGVATRMDWTLPAGFKAGDLLWPPPREVMMAGILAQGFREPVLLLTEITAPPAIEDKALRLAARASWMACAQSCNPGVADLFLDLPVAKPDAPAPRDETVSRRFAQARAALPPPAPANWSVSVRGVASDEVASDEVASDEVASDGVAHDRIELRLVIPGFDPSGAPAIRFFSDDMQVDSDEPQERLVTDPQAGAFRLILARPEFAPDSPDSLSGVLHNPEGWPGVDSPYVEISAPWTTAGSPQ